MHLPIPGPVFGSYPQRLELIKPGLSARAATRALDFLKHTVQSSFVRADNSKFVEQVRTCAQALAKPGSQTFSASLRQARAAVAKEGFQNTALVEAFAHAYSALESALGVRLYDAQLIAARIMLDQKIAEMATGEGKTYAMFCAASVAALAGVPVHVVTANDYLAQRDAEDLAPAYELLGLGVTALNGEVKPDQRVNFYVHHIVYGAAKEFIFDYLLDRSKLQSKETATPSMRGLCLALIDEVDSVLIDEARTPFILAADRPDPHEEKSFGQALAIARALSLKQHFVANAIHREVRLTDAGRDIARQQGDLLGGLWSKHGIYREELVQLALTALHLYRRNVDYVVSPDPKQPDSYIVELIDINSGRIATGRKLSNGLHQLLELKESCPVTSRQHTFAQLTFQRFFTRYHRLGGMSGTVKEAASEIEDVYQLGSQLVPLRVPSRREYLGVQVFRHSRSRWRAVVKLISAQHKRGRPILIGTDSVADSEQLSELLKLSNIRHQVLNAAQSQREAALVAQAGALGAVTVATNMAGRGTDIKLAQGINALGGLLVISCQLNSEARIDRQLHGRCARQGDRGSVITLLSLQEGLFERHLSPRLRNLMGGLQKGDAPLPACIGVPLFHWVQKREQGLARQQRMMISMMDEQNEKQLAISGTGI
jgi:preprotein translocase subunit SecA